MCVCVCVCVCECVCVWVCVCVCVIVFFNKLSIGKKSISNVIISRLIWIFAVCKSLLFSPLAMKELMEMHINIIKLWPLCEGYMTICSSEAGNVNCQSEQILIQYCPRTRATIVLLHRILIIAIALTAMTPTEDNITCEGNVAGKPDRMLPITWDALTEVTSAGNITCEGTCNMTG